MPKLFLFCFLSCCIAFAACKKDDDSVCPVPETTYDPDFVTFPTKNVKWVIFHWGSGGHNRVDTLYIAAEIPFISRTLPYNAVDYSTYEESEKMYYQIKSKYFSYIKSGQDTQSISSTQTAVYSYFRVDTAENKFYELFNGPGAKYEIEVIDWDKKTGDTLYNFYSSTLGSKMVIQNTDSTLIGNHYLRVYNSAIWQGNPFSRRVSNSFWGNATEYSYTLFIYKNDTSKILW